jgi:hypothetical protein
MITPDNVRPAPPRIVHRDGITSVVFQKSDCTLVDGGSVCLGGLMRETGAWGLPGAPVPDGSYALFRTSPSSVELVTDAVASRTIWYAMTDELFIASSSQRAIVSLLGAFSPNRRVFSWLLSSGTLGPTSGWDERLSRVPPGGRVLLERAAWRLSETRAPLEPSTDARRLSRSTYRRHLDDTVHDALGRFELDFSKWLLPLSGGFDSRGLLIALQRSGGPSRQINCVTWGRRDAADDKSGDAYIARELARVTHVGHRYFATDASAEAHDTLIDRFVVAGEGRVAAISGYLDGFRLWKTLHDEGVEGIIRGDEAFGWLPVRHPADVRRTVGLQLLADFFDERARASFDLPEQEVPPALQRAPQETLAAWRDRLYRQFRIPSKLAALTDLKSAYVEVVNPLLAASVVRYASALPDGLRTDKRLWRESVRASSPDVAFAKRAAITPLEDFLREPKVLDLMADELASVDTASLLGNGLVAYCKNAIEAARGRPAAAAKRPAAEWLTHKYRTAARRFGLEQSPVLDGVVFAFRAVLIARTCALFGRDSASLRPRLAASA